MGHTLGRILVVDDEEDFCQVLFVLLKTEGFEPMVAHNGESALDMIRRGLPDAVLLDIRMPGIDGMEVLRRSKAMQPGIPFLIMTAYGGVGDAVEAIKEGAYDFLVKPLDNKGLVEKLTRAISLAAPLKGDSRRPDPAKDAHSVRLREIMGPSEAISKVIKDIALVATSDFTVIIQGETGTGKELVARAIHQASERAKRRMVPLDCGAIPETLFESELFGYEKGAFTGAVSPRSGKFELAQGGTLFLDEIGNMPISCQVKLLRAIQERTFFRVGGKEPVDVNVRLLVATNQDLGTRISAGTFSRDLYYRLSEFTVSIPPLRERTADIVHLSNRFLKATNLELNKKVRGFSDRAEDLLVHHPWPGNVRQLRSTVRRAVLQADSVIQPEHLSLESPTWETDTVVLPHPDVTSWDGLSLREIVKRGTVELECRVLTSVLRKTGGNKAEAARLLQVDYKTMHTKVKRYGITIHSEVSDEQEE
ncbi:MAG: sigma-54 dependent transcriptional regulator [Desulfomonilaceae bacterium]|nr:sigma-54 dependent transcriptional regulator [Desulfomonilaceae bacterium]